MQVTNSKILEVPHDSKLQRGRIDLRALFAGDTG